MPRSRGSLATAALLLLLAGILAPRASAGAADALPEGPIDPALAATAPRISAAAAVLMDAQTGAVLYARRMHQRRDPASTTKIMTALLALEYGRLGDPVTVSRRAASTPGSSMGLRPGDVYALADLLAGLLLGSGNDAAVAIAEHISGSEEAFVARMNQRARELGLRNTRFRNPHGLTAPGHYSSAYDLAVLTRHVLRHPVFRRLVCTRAATACEQVGGRLLRLYNTNRLLWGYALAEGVKTGTTAAAGRCLVAAASLGGHRLIAVVLNAPDRFRDAQELLSWGFAHFSLRRVLEQGEAVAELPVAAGTRPAVRAVAAEPLWVVAPRAAWGSGRLAWRLHLPAQVTAPVRRNAALGRAAVTLDGREVAAVRLVAAEDIPARSWLWRVVQVLMPALRLLAPAP